MSAYTRRTQAELLVSQNYRGNKWRREGGTDDIEAEENEAEDGDVSNVPEVIDESMALLTEEYKSLNYNALMNVATVKHRIENHTLCKHCVLEESVKTADLKVTTDRAGLCTDFVVRCNKKPDPHKFLMCQPILAEDKVDELKKNMLSGAQINKSNIATRPLNHQLLMAMMCTGNGWTEANLMMTLLGAECGISFGAWQKMEECMGMEVQEIADQILDDNLQAELALSEELDDGGIRLECSFDTGWTGATNRNYNSPASIATLIGCKTKKIIAITVKAKVCKDCSNAERDGVDVGTHFCTKNHEGSSKSMEASSAVDLIVEMNARGAPVYTLVGDDDSTVDANLRWSFEEMQKQKELGNPEFADFEWPRDKNGKKMKSIGQLPLHMMQIQKRLADPTHRTKCATKKLFKAAGRSKKNNVEEMSKRCAMRIKTNLGYFLKWCNKLGLAEMMRRAPAVVEHHFGDHTYCGPWCKYSMERPAHIRHAWDDEAKKNYKDKTKNAKLYKLVRECLDPYLTEESLAECAHEYDSQTNEACNKMFTKYAPKTTNFSRSIGLTTRILIGTTVHSVGDLKAVTTIYENMGFSINDATSKFLRKIDARKTYFSAYVKKAAVKRRRAMKLVKKKAEMKAAEAKDKKRGMSYGVDATKIRQPKIGKNGKVIVRKPPSCTACKKAGFPERAVGHRSSSRLYCPEHPMHDGGGLFCKVCGIIGHEYSSPYHCPKHPLHASNLHGDDSTPPPEQHGTMNNEETVPQTNLLLSEESNSEEQDEGNKKSQEASAPKANTMVVRKAPSCRACKKAGFPERAVGHRSSSRLYCPEHPMYGGGEGLSCQVCGITGHQHSSQCHCPKHPNHPPRQGKNVNGDDVSAHLKHHGTINNGETVPQTINQPSGTSTSRPPNLLTHSTYQPPPQRTIRTHATLEPPANRPSQVEEEKDSKEVDQGNKNTPVYSPEPWNALTKVPEGGSTNPPNERTLSPQQWGRPSFSAPPFATEHNTQRDDAPHEETNQQGKQYLSFSEKTIHQTT